MGGRVTNLLERSVRAAAGLAIAALVATACGSGTTSQAPAASAAPTAAPTTAGSTAPSTAPSAAAAATIENIKIAGPGPVMTLDVAKATELSSNNVDLPVPGRRSTATTRTACPSPSSPSPMTPSADGLTNTLKLKAGLKYSDGTPVKAADVKAGVEHQKDKGVGAPFLAGIKEVEVVDDTTAILHMDYPDPDLLLGLTGRSLSINPADKMASDPDYFMHPVSAGPYVVTEFTPNKTLHMQENPNYVFGPMVVKGIDLVYVPDLTRRSSSWRPVSSTSSGICRSRRRTACRRRSSNSPSRSVARTRST